jgi:hypothetical protein
MTGEAARHRTGPVAGGVLVLLSGAGWFALSRGVMGTSVADALGEALGVVLALLVVVSAVAAVFRSRGSHG